MENVIGNELIKTFDNVLGKLNNIFVRKDKKTAQKILKQIEKSDEINKNNNIKLNTTNIAYELKKRDVSREEFLEFYNSGKEKVKEKQKQILEQISLIEEEVGKVFINQETGENLQEKLKDKKISESKRITILEQIRKNATKIVRLSSLLNKEGFENSISTTREANKFKKFLKIYDENIKIQLTNLKIQHNEYKEDIEIFNKEIDKINNELRTIKLSQNEYKDLKKESEDEKKLRAEQIKASMFGNKELEKEWNERVKRYYSHKKQIKDYVYTYKNDNGEIEQRKLNFETIQKYDEIEDDEYFLNLAYYKKYLEITSIYDDIEKRYGSKDALDIIKTIINFNESDKSIKQHIDEMREYVNTFHGFTNEHAVKTEVWKTAGSTLKKMKTIKGAIPMSKKIGNGTENTLRFFGIRKPEFSKTKADGTKVATPGKAALTIVTDAAVVAGVTTTAVLAGPTGLATWGAAYAAKGVVTAANIIKGNIEYKKHKEEIDANLPTLGRTGEDEKELIRKEYYREELKQHKGKNLNTWNMFTTWAHAKSDRLFFRKGAAKEIEEKSVNDRIALSNAVIDQRTQNVEENLQKNEPIVKQNQTIREEYKKKYPNENLGKINTQDLKDVSNSGRTIANTAVTIEQKYTAREQKQDRINKMWTILLTAGMKIGVDAIRTGFKEQVVQEKQVPTEEKVIVSKTKKIPGKKKWVEGEKVNKPILGEKKTIEFDTDKKISDLEYSSDGFSNVYNGVKISGGNKGKVDIDALVLKTKGSNGKTVEVSLAEAGKGFTTNHVHALTNENISDLTITQVIEKLKKADPINYKKYIETIGLNEKSSAVEVAKKTLEKGQMFGQTSKLEGWREVLPTNFQEKVQAVIKGYKEIQGPGRWVRTPDVTKTVDVEKTIQTVKKVTETKNVFKPEKVLDSTLQGSLYGAPLTVADQMHESANQTKKRKEGTFEQCNPNFFTSKIAIKQSEETKKQKAKFQKLIEEQNERKKQTKREFRGR